jgi:hypothetical protein
MILILVIIDFLMLVVAIGLIDYLLFYKVSPCKRCGQKPEIWSWIPATFLELSIFILGLALGVCLR